MEELTLKRKLTDEEKRIKLRESEVINCKTPEEAVAMAKQAHALGLRWISNKTYLDGLQWDKYKEETCYLLHEGEYCDEEFYEKKNKTTISAAEWLNRWGIFLLGQEVISDTGLKVKYLHKRSDAVPYCEIALGDVELFSNIKSPFPEWVEEDEPETHNDTPRTNEAFLNADQMAQNDAEAERMTYEFCCDLERELHACEQLLGQAKDRIFDMVEEPDEYSSKEARKFLESLNNKQ